MTLSPDNDTDRFTCSYSGETGSLSKLRNDVATFLTRSGVGVDLQDRIALALTELATNAIEAAAGHAYTVTVQVSAAAVTASVANIRPLLRPRTSGSEPQRQRHNAVPRADGIPPHTVWGPEETLAPRGRGLLLVEALSDSLRIDNEDSTTTATVVLQR